MRVALHIHLLFLVRPLLLKCQPIDCLSPCLYLFNLSLHLSMSLSPPCTPSRIHSYSLAAHIQSGEDMQHFFVPSYCFKDATCYLDATREYTRKRKNNIDAYDNEHLFLLVNFAHNFTYVVSGCTKRDTASPPVCFRAFGKVWSV